MRLATIFLAVLLLGACHNGDSSSPVDLPGTIGSLILFGESEACVIQDNPYFPSHDSYSCIDEDGYHYQIDIPALREINTAIMLIHGSGSDAEESRGMLANNSPYHTLADKLLIYPQAKRYLYGSSLWNGSGERQPGDNGCCVNNGLSDRQFISRLVEDVDTTLPSAPFHMVGLSNGGMLALDLAYNTQLRVHTYFIVVASDQTTTMSNTTIDTNIVMIGARDDEVIPFYGGLLDFSGHEAYVGLVNAGNHQVSAPAFGDTVEKLLSIKDCVAGSSGASGAGYAWVSNYHCEQGMIATMVFDVSGHRLGSYSLVDETPQRLGVMAFISQWIESAGI